MKLLRIHLISVNVAHGWLVTSNDARWSVDDSKYFTPKQGKDRALSYARKKAREYGEASIRIRGRNGRFQEERTFPRSRDPQRTKG